jgi:hypothetical protein
LGTGARRVGFSNAFAAGASAMKVKRRIVFALAGLFARLLSDALRLFQPLAVRFDGGGACSGRLATRSCSKAVSDALWECARGVFATSFEAEAELCQACGGKKPCGELVRNPLFGSGVVIWESCLPVLRAIPPARLGRRSRATG